jgi:hypothetical protein
MPHVALAVHMRLEEHASPVQHGWPEPPHVAHKPAPVHPRPAPHAIVPPQHGSPAPPHAAQVPIVSHPSPAPQESPAQQGWPAAPHWPQT